MPLECRSFAIADTAVWTAAHAWRDDHSSRRRACDRGIAGALRESAQLEVGVRCSSSASKRQSIGRGRAIRCLPASRE